MEWLYTLFFGVVTFVILLFGKWVYDAVIVYDGVKALLATVLFAVITWLVIVARPEIAGEERENQRRVKGQRWRRRDVYRAVEIGFLILTFGGAMVYSVILIVIGSK